MTPKKVVERGVWSEAEHDRFLTALKVHPKGPWRIIAAQVGTRSARQVQTHAQKYYEKVARRMRGLRKERKKLVRAEHRLDIDIIQLCQDTENAALSAPGATPPRPRATRAIATTTPPSLNTNSAVPKSRHECAHTPGSLVVADANAQQPDASFLSLLLGKSDEQRALEDYEVSDSDDIDSLADVDEYYLDFLIDALSGRDDCTSSDGSSSE